LAEYDAAVSEKQTCDVSLDDEFDEIFGDSMITSAEPVLAATGNPSLSSSTEGLRDLQPSTDKYDAEFDEIFGEGTNATTSAPSEHGKKHDVHGEGDNTATGDEVRRGTPTTDITIS
ncbi:hypothetical protein PHMEG_00021582, partial [Phytophthora megakarya]